MAWLLHVLRLQRPLQGAHSALPRRLGGARSARASPRRGGAAVRHQTSAALEKYGENNQKTRKRWANREIE